MKTKAITLIELVIVIAICAIAVTALIGVFSQTLRAFVLNEKMNTAIDLAQAKMAELVTKDFYLLRDSTTAGGPFFDLDCPCPAGKHWTTTTTDPLYSYFYCIQIRSINPESSDLGAGDLAGTGAVITREGDEKDYGDSDLTKGRPRSNYLRIKVQVWNEKFANKKVELVTLVTPNTY